MQSHGTWVHKIMQTSTPKLCPSDIKLTHTHTHLIYDAFVVLNEAAEVHSWTPDVVLTVKTAAGLLRVLMLSDGHLISEDMQREGRERVRWWDKDIREKKGGPDTERGRERHKLDKRGEGDRKKERKREQSGRVVVQLTIICLSSRWL